MLLSRISMTIHDGNFSNWFMFVRVRNQESGMDSEFMNCTFSTHNILMLYWRPPTKNDNVDDWIIKLIYYRPSDGEHLSTWYDWRHAKCGPIHEIQILSSKLISVIISSKWILEFDSKLLFVAFCRGFWGNSRHEMRYAQYCILYLLTLIYTFQFSILYQFSEYCNELIILLNIARIFHSHPSKLFVVFALEKCNCLSL